MPDDFDEYKDYELKRIGVEEDWEVRYWSEKLSVSEEQLRDAVKTVGHGVEAVTTYLRH